MPTSWTPEWDKLPLVFGLLMAGFSGHAVVPSLARDMAEPERFDEVSERREPSHIEEDS